MLDVQRAIEHKRKRNNLRTLFGVQRIPGADQIRNMVDEIEPEALPGVFNTALAKAREVGFLERDRVLHGTLPVALDGTWYFASKEIHGERCLRLEVPKSGGKTQTVYYYDVLAAAEVQPGCPTVLPLIRECIRNEEGNGKQNGERNAAQRWLQWHSERYSSLELTI